MSFEQDKACNMSGEMLQNFEKTFSPFKAWHIYIIIIYNYYIHGLCNDMRQPSKALYTENICITARTLF